MNYKTLLKIFAKFDFNRKILKNVPLSIECKSITEYIDKMEFLQYDSLDGVNYYLERVFERCSQSFRFTCPEQANKYLEQKNLKINQNYYSNLCRCYDCDIEEMDCCALATFIFRYDIIRDLTYYKEQVFYNLKLI